MLNSQAMAFGRDTHLRILLKELLIAHPPFQLTGEAVWSHMEGGHHMGVARLPVEFLDHAV